MVPDFWEAYNRLPEEIRTVADRSYQLLKDDPNHPSLQFKLIGKIYSVRVGLHYRAIATPRDGEYLWFWIGHHSEYDLLVRKLR